MIPVLVGIALAGVGYVVLALLVVGYALTAPRRKGPP